MIGFQVQVNDEAPIRAADTAISVLSAITSYVVSSSEIELTIGGLIASHSSPGEHVEWLQRALKLGDRIVLTVVDTVEPDPPARRTREDPGVAEEQERRYYERLKARFERS
jgi:hypothetical protein